MSRAKHLSGNAYEGRRKVAIPPGTLADSAAKVGEIIDRLEEDHVMGINLMVDATIATSAGASGHEVDLLIQLYSGDESDMSDETLLKSVTVSLVVDANDGNHYLHGELPASLEGAGQYLRAKVTGSTDATFGTSYVSAVACLTGKQRQPIAAFDPDGFLGDSAVNF